MRLKIIFETGNCMPFSHIIFQFSYVYQFCHIGVLLSDMFFIHTVQNGDKQSNESHKKMKKTITVSGILLYMTNKAYYI